MAVVKWWYTGLSGLLLHAENIAVIWWAAASTSPSAPMIAGEKELTAQRLISTFQTSHFFVFLHNPQTD